MLGVSSHSGKEEESAENDEWFNRLNEILKVILFEFREGRPALERCAELVEAADELFKNGEKFDGCGLATLAAISAKLLLTQIQKEPKLRPAVSYLFSFVSVVFSNAGACDVPFSYISELLSTLPHYASAEPNEAVNAVCSVINFALLNAALSSELFKIEQKYIVGFVFSMLLNIFSDESADSSVRIKAGDLMLRICEPNESYEVISFLLPGICQSAMKVACSVEPKSYKITVVALEVFARVVVLVLGSETVRERDKKWLEQAEQRVVQMISKVTNRLCASSDHRVRESLMDSVFEIRSKCQVVLESKIDEKLVDILVNFSVDTYESISAKADSRLTEFRQRNNDFLIKLLTSRLHRVCSTLPYSVEKSLSNEPLVLERIHALMHSLASEDLERVVRCSPQFVSQLLDGLAASIRIDMKRLKVSSEGGLSKEWKTLSLYPLKFSMTPNHLVNIAEELVKTGCSEMIFDHIVDRIFADTYKQDKIGFFLISACFLHAGESAISSYFEATLKTLRKLVTSIEAEVKDEIIEDLQLRHSDDSCLAAIALTALGEAMAKVDPGSEQFGRLMLDVLYDTLQFCSSSNLVVKEAAVQVIHDLAENQNISQSALLLRFAPFIVHRLDIHSRDFMSNIRSPLVLVQLLEFCDDSSLYEQVRFIVSDLLNALDRYNQKWTILILRALLAFTQAISRWFQNLKPILKSNNDGDQSQLDSDDETNDTIQEVEDSNSYEVPKPIASVVDVLMRTKHMVSSPHLPIKVLVLDILEASLRAVRHFENQLLPVIHQNWLGLVARFKFPWGDVSPDHLHVATKAIQIAVTMCELSGTFVYRKIVDEMWPLVEQYIQTASKGSRKTRKSYAHTSAFKYQMAVIKSSEQFVIHLNLKTDKERERIVKLLEIYAGDEAQNCDLREEAQRVLNAVRKFK